MQLDDSTLIVRYLDIAEFLGILNKRIKFTSLSKLREHDSYEFNFDQNQLKVDRIQFSGDVLSVDEVEKMVQDREWPKLWHALCWCSEKTKRMALWKIFASLGKGVRIETDIGSLRKSVAWPLELYAHTVSYRKNNESNTIYEGSFTKGEEFSYESEIRIALQIMKHHNRDYFLVPIDPKVLVKKIVVGPQSR